MTDMVKNMSENFMTGGFDGLFDCFSIEKLENVTSETKICVGLVALLLLLGLVLLYLYMTGKLNSIGLNIPFLGGNKEDDYQLVNQEDDNDVISDNSNSVKVILFYADWCNHCKKMKPEWEKASDKLNNQVLNNKMIKMVALNGDENMELVEKHDIVGYPTILAEVNGEIKTMEEEPNQENIYNFLDSITK